MPVPASLPPDVRAYLEELEKRVDNLARVQIVKHKLFTKATLPSASDSRFKYGTAIASDATSNKVLVVSDGTIWRYPDGDAV